MLLISKLLSFSPSGAIFVILPKNRLGLKFFWLIIVKKLIRNTSENQKFGTRHLGHSEIILRKPDIL